MEVTKRKREEQGWQCRNGLTPPRSDHFLLRQESASNHFGCSRITSVGVLSSRQPKNVVWRNCSSSVHSANATSQTSLGLTHWIFSGIFGGFSTVGLSSSEGTGSST